LFDGKPTGLISMRICGTADKLQVHFDYAQGRDCGRDADFRRGEAEKGSAKRGLNLKQKTFFQLHGSGYRMLTVNLLVNLIRAGMS
jgi:hypothetical protein